MRIQDRDLTIELPDDDPRAIRIRQLLLANHPDPERRLWDEFTDSHRSLMRSVAATGEISQPCLEAALEVDGVGLRGLTTGLSKIVKRLGVRHPLQSTGSRRDTRRFIIDPDFRQFVQSRNVQNPNT